jgi:hypothetical protein
MVWLDPGRRYGFCRFYDREQPASTPFVRANCANSHRYITEGLIVIHVDTDSGSMFPDIHLNVAWADRGAVSPPLGSVTRSQPGSKQSPKTLGTSSVRATHNRSLREEPMLVTRCPRVGPSAEAVRSTLINAFQSEMRAGAGGIVHCDPGLRRHQG